MTEVLPGRLLVTRRLLLLGAALGAIWTWLPFLSAEAAYVALPAALCATMVTVFCFVLWKRTGPLPIFELGAVFAVIMALYAVVPVLGFISGGLAWTSLSDGRLLFYNPQAQEVAEFAWPYVGLVAAFTGTYLYVRRSALPPLQPVPPIDRATLAALLLLLAGAQGYERLIEYLYGITLDPTYLDGGLTTFSNYYSAPYIVQQITHNVVGAVLALKVCLAGALLAGWRSRPYRITLCIWVVVEVVASFLNMGSRTYMALFVFATVLLYHRLVRPLKPRLALGAGAVMLIGFFLYGAMRDSGGSLQNAYGREARIWTANNDFQTMFASAYDVSMTKTRLGFGNIPWQIYASDLYLLVPSQFLPFDKLEPSTWYYTFTRSSTSQMFGIVAQSIVGFGWLELALRGMLLGYAFAKIHHWYVRRSGSYWTTLLYTYGCLWCHYVFRATTGWPLYFVVYEFLPVMVAAQLIAAQIRRATLPRPAVAP